MTILIPQLEHLMCHGTAGDADDKLEHEGGNGVARVTGKDIRQRQTDGTRQTAGYTVQQQRRQGGKGVAQMERRTAVERDAEEQVSHKAQRSHHAGKRQLVHRKAALVQHTEKQDQDNDDCQQQPHCSSRHDTFPPITPITPQNHLTFGCSAGMLLLYAELTL